MPTSTHVGSAVEPDPGLAPSTAHAAHEPDATGSTSPVLGLPTATPGAPTPTTSTAGSPHPQPSAPVVPAHVAEQLTTHLRGLHRTTDGRHEATLVLDPEHLGPVRVRLTLDDGALHVQLSSLAASTGDALRDALPDLRRQLADAGLTLGSADVTDQGSWQGREAQHDAPRRSAPQHETRDAIRPLTTGAAPARPRHAGGVDLVV
jgi:flagellar hook-length control protein FliK